MNNSEIIVSIYLDNETIKVGTLWPHTQNRRESCSFEYDSSWLEHPKRFALEPSLRLTKGSFHTGTQAIFGALGDSVPDRWGRVLIRRAANYKAKYENTTPKTLLEIDYILGVNDVARQGALRFSTPERPEVFRASKDKTAIPPLIKLPRLMSATERFIADEETSEDLKLLLAPGSSLGGSRPKASILDQDGSLAIAKFGSKHDEFNVVAWEAVALELAKQAGINVPEWRLENILGKHVLIIKRFDRMSGQRIPFLSAMSMLGAKDNEQHSYLEIAYALSQYGASPEADTHELWRRIVFNIMIANTDDHLRNHGFLHEQYKGWRLSPAYDMNPTPIEVKPRILTTAIDFENAQADLEIAKRVAKEFRLNTAKADQIISEVANTVENWRKVASYYGISKQECDRMSSAFNTNK